ncbi:troponin T-like isoform X2 [Lineus longissimus]|uniref:troponin T-like isoform X2 n=1 Tax=Lineus longissimus TaxID=88925 RepID=UPI00315C9C01
MTYIVVHFTNHVYADGHKIKMDSEVERTTKLDDELERTKKMMRSQNGGVASIRDQWSKKGSTSDDGETPKPSGTGRRPLDVNIALNASSGSVRDRWKKMANTNESESTAAPSEKPRRKKQDDDFQSVLRRFNTNFSLDKNGKESKTPEKIMIDPFARFEDLEIDKEKMRKELDEDEKKREERKKEREALLKKIEEDSEKRRKAEQEETRKRLEADKKRREMARKKREEEATMNAVNGEPKRNFVIPKRSHDQVSNIMKAKEENNKTKGELILDKKAVLAKRIQPLDIEGFTHEELLEKAKELYDAIYELESEKIDFEKSVERQQYDIMELKERANQMQVSTTPSPKPVALPLKTGLGVGKLSERFSSSAPPKVQVSSPHQNGPYTRLNNDGKSFTDKFKMFETMAKK